jgi:hypothetical protein
MTLRKPFLFAFAITLGLFGATAAIAWTGPSAAPPSGNASAPLNTSATGQVKVGGLQLNTGGAATGLLVQGNVGIGTTNPRSALEINGKLLNTAAYGANPNLLAYDVGVGSVGAGTVYGYDALCTGNNSGYCNSAGGVVIGRSNTSANVNITNSGTTFFNNVQVVIGGTVPYSGNARLTINNPSPATWTQIVNYNNGSPSGQYGIYVYGSTYALYANGPVYGTAFYYLSDERAKKNVEAIASSTALQKILALEPVTYNWKDADKPAGTQIGFIAQQVKKVVPELVLTDASTTQESVDYARVAPLLVGAVQAQQARIDAQQKEIDDLKAEVRALRAGK